jgi:hypothetical protein
MSGFTNTEVPKDWKQYLMIESKNEDVDLEKRNMEEEKIPEVSKVEVEARTEEKILESKEITNIFESYENEIERLKQDNSQTDIIQNEKIESKYNTEDKLINESKENNVIHQVQQAPRSDDFSKELKDSYFYGTKKEEYPNGTVGEFFKLLAEDFEEQKDSCTEIKNCRWYKVPINTLDDMCNASNYNKYTIVYYPMISYFPYIKKHNHYIIGYKYDTKGKMKYLVYGIPGTKNKADQPYSGKSGFVTWVPLREGDEREDSFGYWLMFYDFRASTIVIPVK